MGEESEQSADGAQPVRMSERQFAAHVDALAAQADSAELLSLLDERQTVYAERGAAAVVRMRGWVLRALCDSTLPPSGLLYVLEELDNGRDAYLVASAARALRILEPSERFAPYLLKALANVRFHDDALCFDRYGGYAVEGEPETAFREVLRTIGWLGSSAHSVVGPLRELLPELGATDAEATQRAITAIESSATASTAGPSCCTGGLDFLRELRAFKTWAAGERTANTALSAVVFEDQSGNGIRYDEFFLGQPSIVVFFYTRCDNPEKCSLAVHKLGNVVRLLTERGLEKRIRTAAISYDPGWDAPERMSGYAKNRRLPFDDEHRLLRSVKGEDVLRAHFALGVNFVESLVNRHRVELFILDARGRIAASFERLQWDEAHVVEEAAALMREVDSELPSKKLVTSPSPEPPRGADAKRSLHAVSSLGLAFVTAFFPKCPVCWAAYLSWLGVAELDSLRGLSPWILLGVIALLGLNLASVWRRATALGGLLPFWLSAAGAVTILVFGLGLESSLGTTLGLSMSALGALASVFGRVRFSRRQARMAH